MKTLMNGQAVEILNHAKGWFSVKTQDGQTKSVRRAALDFVNDDAPATEATGQAAPVAATEAPQPTEAKETTMATKKAPKSTKKATKAAAKKAAPKAAAKKAAGKPNNSNGVRTLRTANGKDYEYTVAGKTANGNKAYDNGDDVAAKLRGKTLDEVYTLCAKAMAKKGGYKGDFAKCESAEQMEKALRKSLKDAANVGRVRMVLGNRMRAALRVAD